MIWPVVLNMAFSVPFWVSSEDLGLEFNCVAMI